MNFANFWTGTPQEYAHLLYITYAAIKSADPDAKVLIAGEASQGTDGSFYTQVIQELTSNTLYKSSRCFDIADIHVYGSENQYTDIETYANRFRGYLTGTIYDGIPLWVMESGTYTGDPKTLPYIAQTEQQQARSLIKRYIVGFKNNIEKIFWSPGLVESYAVNDTPNGFFDLMGLIYNGLPQGDANDKGSWVKKLSYFSYKMLLESMGRNVNYLGDLSLNLPNLYGYRFNCDSKNCYVLWSESGTTTASFSVGTPTVNVTNLIVDAVTSQTEQYQLTRDTNNKIMLSVGLDPLLVEEIVTPNPAPSPDIVPVFSFSYAKEVISTSGVFEITDTSIPPNITISNPTSTNIKDAVTGGYNNSALRITSQLSNTNIILDMGVGTEIKDGIGNDLSIARSSGSAPLTIEISNSSTFQTDVHSIGTIPSNSSTSTFAFNIGNDNDTTYRYIRLTIAGRSIGYVDVERVQAMHYGASSPVPVELRELSCD